MSEDEIIAYRIQQRDKQIIRRIRSASANIHPKLGFEIDLSGCGLCDKDLPPIIDELLRIKLPIGTLDLSNNYITGQSVPEFVKLLPLSIEEFILSGCHFSTSEQLIPLLENPKLKWLVLRRNGLTEEAINTVIRYSQQEYVDLSDNPCTRNRIHGPAKLQRIKDHFSAKGRQALEAQKAADASTLTNMFSAAPHDDEGSKKKSTQQKSQSFKAPNPFTFLSDAAKDTRHTPSPPIAIEL